MSDYPTALDIRRRTRYNGRMSPDSDPSQDKLKLTVLFNTKAEFDENEMVNFLNAIDLAIMDYTTKYNIPVELIQGMLETIPNEN